MAPIFAMGESNRDERIPERVPLGMAVVVVS